jgi:hypothetical protein
LRGSDGSDISKRDLLKVAASAAAASAAVGATSAQAYGIDGVQDALNQTGRQRLPFRQGQRTWFANIANWYEFPTTNPEILEVWAYADKLSYAPGDTVALHVNTTADTYSFEVFRDGGTLDSVLKQEGIAGAYHDTPLEAYEPGCNWPVSTQSTIPADWKSGGYVIVLTVERDGTKIEHEAFFVLRSATPGRTAKILFLPAIPTWIAYNDWAGGCSYRLPPEAGGGGREARETSYAVHTSTHKPWPRGFIRFPEVGIDGFLQEKAAGTVPINWEITYPEFDYVFANGYAMFSWMAGWGYFDRHFAIWAEQNGYEMDYASMHDIYDNPALLEPYDLIVQVGHGFPTGTTPMPMPRISLGRRIIRRAGPLRRPPSVRAWARGPSLTSPMATPRASASTCSGPTARRVASPSLSMAAIGGVSANPTGRIWPPRPWRQAGPWRCRNTAWPPPPASTRSPMRSAPPSTCWRCGSMGRSASQAIRRAGIWPPGWSAATRRCRRAFRRASPMC